MATRRKRRTEEKIEKKATDKAIRLPIYTPFKEFLERHNVDSDTAGHTAWLLVSFIIACVLGFLITFILPLFIRYYMFSSENDVLVRMMCFSIFSHAFVVMIRPKYLYTNIVFFVMFYLCFILVKVDSTLLFCIACIIFLAYMIMPFYSWRIKVLDTILYFIYTVVFYHALHS